jgi:hypothetical protein
MGISLWTDQKFLGSCSKSTRTEVNIAAVAADLVKNDLESHQEW